MHEALQFLDQPAILRHARINAVDGERFGVVSAEGHRYWLKPALGCLLQPAVGDCVLISLSGDQGYVLSVLERSQAQSSELRVPGDLYLNLPMGALNIRARDGMALDAGPSLKVEAQSSSARFSKTEISVDRLSVTGVRSDSHWQELNEHAERISQQATRHDAQYGDSRRQVQGHEDVHAGSLRQRIDGDWSVRGETLDLFADVAVAIDAQRIKLG
ncbi:DUF3540 domain-containing protein [Pseudomonas sp. TNT11]|uniref:DUF3540 domain-containing protein n=1 Tax=Pseudomonas emilianonis TaxID=2915812 RepID=A0ABT0EEL7_9PSED|nr:DUF3540 domain-containing protein [Pseudomonas emilianonis]MCK1784146.1 DUF3540 domain-containing protein [Pseudomonas emilianonis]